VKRLLLAALIGAASLTACGGGGSSTPSPVAPATLGPGAGPSAQPSPTATPSAAPQSSVASFDFSSNAATTFTVTESGYTGAFRESDTCDPLTGEIAAVSAVASPPPGSANYTVTPIGPGTCQITIDDDAAKSVAIPVTVSAAAITVQ